MTHAAIVANNSSVLSALRQAICQLPDCQSYRPDSIEPDHSLTAELGVDSVSVIELGFYIEQSLGADVAIVDWYEAAAPEHSLASLHAHVLEHVHAEARPQ